MHLSNRRIFVGAALEGLGAMMVGCGNDRRAHTSLSSPNNGEGPVVRGQGGAIEAPEKPPGRGGRDAGQPAPFPEFGPLGAANELGVRVPDDYSVRLLATSGVSVDVPSRYVWHDFPDGAACFERPDGSWIYVSNSERSTGSGSVGALVFSAEGEPTDAYSIAGSLSKPCQGGVTPWNTWLSCEEVSQGRVIECDPLGRSSPTERPSLGLFTHEGLAYDLNQHHLYMTEDLTDGLLYRFVPSRLTGGYADLTNGTLQAARLIDDSRLDWIDVPDPGLVHGTPTRHQLGEAARFNGGEGIWYQNDQIIFTTKGDDRVWSYDTRTTRLRIIYDRLQASNPLLSGVDCVIGTSAGEFLVAEDLGDMQIIAILPSGELRALLQIENQASSEITGLAFSPDGRRLYFSSQRGGAAGRGQTYEVTGPFLGRE